MRHYCSKRVFVDSGIEGPLVLKAYPLGWVKSEPKPWQRGNRQNNPGRKKTAGKGPNKNNPATNISSMIPSAAENYTTNKPAPDHVDFLRLEAGRAGETVIPSAAENYTTNKPAPDHVDFLRLEAGAGERTVVTQTANYDFWTQAMTEAEMNGGTITSYALLQVRLRRRTYASCRRA